MTIGYTLLRLDSTDRSVIECQATLHARAFIVVIARSRCDHNGQWRDGRGRDATPRGGHVSSLLCVYPCAALCMRDNETKLLNGILSSARGPRESLTRLPLENPHHTLRAIMQRRFIQRDETLLRSCYFNSERSRGGGEKEGRRDERPIVRRVVREAAKREGRDDTPE